MKKPISKSLFLGLLLLLSCQQQDIQIKKEKLAKVAFSSLDREEKLANALKGINVTVNKGGRIMNVLENINSDSILKVLQSDSTSYTFTMRLKNDNNRLSFKNLVFRRTLNGFVGFLLEYESPIEQSDLSKYTGTVKKYDLEGKLLQELSLKNGIVNGSKGGRTASCTLAGFSKSCAEQIFDGWDHTTGAPIFKCGRYTVFITFDCYDYVPSEPPTSYGTFIADYRPGGGGGGGSGVSNIQGNYNRNTEFSTFDPGDPMGVWPPPTADEILQAIIDATTDPEEKRKAQLDYIRTHDGQDGRDFTAMVEEIVRTPDITVGDVFEINATVNRYYLNLRGQYMIAVYDPFAKAARFLIELALIETGTEVLFNAAKLALSTRYGILATQAGRQTWNGFAKIFKANTDDILAAAKRIKDYRKSTGNLTGGNYGYLEGTVNNAAVDNKMWRSGTALADEPKIFTAIEVEGAGGKTWLRTTDSEYKMLNKLASDLGGTPGAVKSNIYGEIKIISENPYCASCQGIIQQFNQMFPNIKLILIDGAK